MSRSAAVAFYLSTCLGFLSGCIGGEHEDRLITDLLDNSKHQKYGRPVKYESEALEVQFKLSLQQIIEVDEKNEMLHTNMWLDYFWKDHKLRWNESDYGNVTSIRLPSAVMWVPDILMYNSADEDIDSKFPTNVVVYSDGNCSWVPPGLFISSCPIDIRWFPFDEQKCIMKFGSWTYDGGKINLTSPSDKIDLTTYQPSGEWDLIDAPAERHELLYECCPDPYIDITFTIHIRRRTLYFGFNLIIPCFLISFLALLTFLLPPDAGEKIGLGITILLSLSVFQLIVAETVPATSMAVPLLGMYFAVVMIMSTISVVMTVVVLNFHHRNPDMYEMPRIIKIIVCDWLAWVLRMSRPGHEINLQNLKRRATIRDLEDKFPQSPSLLANVQDIDNVIPVSGYAMWRNVSSDNGAIPGSRKDTGIVMDCDLDVSLKTEIRAILNELRYITKSMKDNVKDGKETNDWKWAAMVIDRLCFWIFTLYLSISTLVIFFTAPNLIV